LPNNKQIKRLWESKDFIKIEPFSHIRESLPKKGIEISVLPIPINSSLSRIKKSWMHF